MWGGREEGLGFRVMINLKEDSEAIAIHLQSLHDCLHGSICLHHHMLLPEYEKDFIRCFCEGHPKQLPCTVYRLCLVLQLERKKNIPHKLYQNVLRLQPSSVAIKDS